MTKSNDNKKDTAVIILDKALEMFNVKGIEYVGMRELAQALDMRIGNITYYYPTKDELVKKIGEGLANLNSATIVVEKNMTMLGFLRMLNTVFYNHLQYRCLMLSFVHLMEQNPLIAKQYSGIEKQRNNNMAVNLEGLKKRGYITMKTKKDTEFLVPAIAFIARFWISEAAISYKHLTAKQQIAHYIGMITKIFLPYATAKGKKEIEIFLKGR